MASSTRGKLKEHTEGIHRDCEWIKQHCTACLAMLPPKYESLRDNYEALVKITDQLDKFAMSLYAKL